MDAAVSQCADLGRVSPQKTMDNLSRILYLSRTSLSVDDDELKHILETSRRKNKERQITGILCGGGGHFIQVLEGPQEELLRLYHALLNDQRHYDLVLIGVAPIKQRIFTGWSMGYIANSPETMEARRAALLRSWQDRTEAGELITMMRRFLEQLAS